MAAIYILHIYSLNYMKETTESFCTDKVKKKNMPSVGMKVFPLFFILLFVCDIDLLHMSVVYIGVRLPYLSGVQWCHLHVYKW